jgi:hypothetical protein
MSRLFEWFRELLQALFLIFFFLSIFIGINEFVRKKEVGDKSAMPILAAFWAFWLLLFFIWLALWRFGLVPASLL